MSGAPRWLAPVMLWLYAAYAFVFGLTVLAGRPRPLSTLAALALFAGAFVLTRFRPGTGRAAAARAVVVGVVGLLLPVLGSATLDPRSDSYSDGAWYVSGAVCLAVALLLQRRPRLAGAVLAGLLVQTLLWAGPWGLLRFGIFATVLMVCVLTASAWAIGATATAISRYAEAERQALTWRAAQDAYRSERQVRLANTALVAAPMLRRIADARGHLEDADRGECRLLAESIRDEIRGRRLLNGAVRDRITALRRRGATVQVNDDGGLDDLEPALLEPLLARVADALADVRSDRVVIRTAPADSDKAVSVVAMSTDPVAAALGLDDGDDRVDLWLELDRPERA